MDIKDVKTLEDIKNIDRIVKTKAELDSVINKSLHDLKGFKFQPGEYFGKNYSYCNFDGTDISGCEFKRCNFSFSVGLGGAKTDAKTQFIESNLSGAETPVSKVLEKCNLTRFTDKDIENMFNEERV